MGTIVSKKIKIPVNPENDIHNEYQFIYVSITDSNYINYIDRGFTLVNCSKPNENIVLLRKRKNIDEISVGKIYDPKFQNGYTFIGLVHGFRLTGMFKKTLIVAEEITQECVRLSKTAV